MAKKGLTMWITCKMCGKRINPANSMGAVCAEDHVAEKEKLMAKIIELQKKLDKYTKRGSGKMVKLQFDFKLISKDNEKIFNRAGRPFLSPKYREFSEQVKHEAKKQYKDLPLQGDISIYILSRFKNKRHCDCSNLPKGVIDDLQGICYLNDRQIKRLECIVMDNESLDSFLVMVEETK